MPQLNLPKFNGEFSEFISWWDSFNSAIHTNDRLSSIDKFNYLVTYLEGRAKAAISGIQITSENYQTAIDILSKRFNKPRLIIKHLLGDILPPVTISNSLASIRELYTKFEVTSRHLANFKDKGIDSASVGLVFSVLLQLHLPEYLVVEFERKFSGNEMPSLNQTLNFLESEISYHENLEIHRSCQVGGAGQNDLYFDRLTGAASGGNSRNRFDQKSPPTVGALAAGANSGNNNRNKCTFCSSNQHFSNHCDKIRGLSRDQTVEKIKEANACFRCFRMGHRAQQCGFTPKCPNCNGPHFKALCYNKTNFRNNTVTNSNFVRKQPPRVPARTNLVSAESGDMQPQISNPEIITDPDELSVVQPQAALVGQASLKFGLHQTITAKACSGDNVMLINILFDNAAPCSFIKESLAKKLNLPVIRRDPLALEGIGTMKYIKSSYDRFQVKLQSLKGDMSYDICAYGLKEICNVNHEYHSGLKGELLKWGIGIQESEIYNNDIHLLIG